MSVCHGCYGEAAKRIRCNICRLLFCRVCIGMGTTTKDLGGPICEKCTNK